MEGWIFRGREATTRDYGGGAIGGEGGAAISGDDSGKLRGVLDNGGNIGGDGERQYVSTHIYVNNAKIKTDWTYFG